MNANPDAAASVRREIEIGAAVQAELDTTLSSAAVESTAAHVAEILRRQSELDAARQRAATKASSDRTENRLVVVLTSLVFGLPTTALLWHSDGPYAALATWAAIIALNVVFNSGSRPDRKG